MTIEQISDAAKRLKKKYDENDPERLAEQMKILVSREPMGLFEGCCKGFFLIHRRKKHITINSDLPDIVLEVLNDDMFFFQAAKTLYVPFELLDFKFRILKRRGYKVESPITANGDFLKNLEQQTDVPAFD